ncbi:MAG: chitobiase/beta-hexosaminidase C-terminal domain-containing protein, partial [Bryobacteraceae bacterium]
ATVKATSQANSSAYGTAAVTVAADQQPHVTSVSPSSGSGIGGTFVFAGTDADGGTDISAFQFTFSSTDSSKQCHVMYWVDGPSFVLFNDSDSGTSPNIYNGGSTSNSYCTVSGGTLTTNGNTRSLSINVSFTSAFVGTKNTYLSVSDWSGAYEGYVQVGSWTAMTQAAMPMFSLAAGTYTSDQTVTLSTATGGASIRYTTDGTSPTEGAGNLYTGPITVDRSETVKAVAYGTYYLASPVASATYTMQAVTPTFSVASGTYAGAFSLTLSTTTTGATIHYTTDGSTPTSNSTTYTGAITVSSSATVKAVAVKAGYSDSGVATATYVIVAVAVSPTSANIPHGGTQQFSAAVTGTGNTAVTWSVASGPGSISSAGLYTAPSTTSSGFTATVRATSQALTSAYGSATVTVGANQQPHVTSVSPSSGSGSGGTFVFTGTDADGGTDINAFQFTFTNDDWSKQCHVMYWVDGSSFVLFNDNDSGTSPNIYNGGSTSNSYCTVSGASVSTSGNTRSLSISVSFTTAFAGAKNTDLAVSDWAGSYEGYVQVGSWTVQ